MHDWINANKNAQVLAKRLEERRVKIQ